MRHSDSCVKHFARPAGQVCATVLRSCLDAATGETLPWGDLQTVFGQVMYGGHLGDRCGSFPPRPTPNPQPDRSAWHSFRLLASPPLQGPAVFRNPEPYDSGYFAGIGRRVRPESPTDRAPLFSRTFANS